MKIPSGWEDFFHQEMKKPYFIELGKFINHAYATTTVYPPKDKIFRVFDLIKPQEVKVVILGQDPYHGYNQANGIAFSTNDKKIPKSLYNMFEELKYDLNIDHFESNDLTGWVQQGVFLLNTCLTVEKHQPLSHQNIGWETFVENVLNYLNNLNLGVLFCAFGKNAYRMYSKITSINYENVLTFGHPSPFSYAQYFRHKRCYSAINNWLANHNKQPIDWSK